MSKLEKQISDLINTLPISRNRQVLRLRFGLGRFKPHTLEGIGQGYGITRERVRQIEKDSLGRLRQQDKFKSLLPVFNKLDKYFEQSGKVLLEERILDLLASRSVGLFLLALGEPYFSRPTNTYYLAHWASCPDSLAQADKMIKYFLDYFKKLNKPVTISELLPKTSGLSPEVLTSYLSISRLIDANPFDQWGLTSWPEIKPRGVKDKAYLILARENNPLHFTKITALINQVDFSDDRKAIPQTVHNELIKDPRFKWVDRGVYGLQ